MSLAGNIFMVGLFVGVAILLIFIVKRRMSDVKVKDANIPGQINDIIKKVVSDGIGYKAVPVISKQSVGSMLKDTIKDKVLSELTGHRFFTYEPNERFVLIYGNMQMFFVPIYDNIHTKEIKADLTKITQVSVEDLLKVKSNGSGSSITLVYTNKEKFLFGTLNEFYFQGASAKNEKEEFAEFIHNFENSVNK